jgi:hypothetical protein
MMIAMVLASFTAKRNCWKSRLALMTGLIFFSFAAGMQAAAEECYSPSPSYMGGQTPFDPIKIRELSRSEQQMLSALFYSMHGRWKGNGEEIQCWGNLESHRLERVLYDLDAEGSRSLRERLRLRIRLYSKTEKTNQPLEISFYLIDNLLRFNEEDGVGDVELIELSQNRVRFLQRGRSGPATLHREVFIDLTADRKSFTFKRRVYTQGRFTFARKLHFRR